MNDTIGIQNLILALQQALVPSSYAGVVGAGSAADTVVDATGGFSADQWANWGIQFRADTTTAALRGAWQKINSNTGTDLVLAGNLPAVPVAGDTFNIRPFGANVFDLQAVGGTAQTGADWTPLLQTIGLVADAVVAAGATGSLSAKLRRLTTDLDALLTSAGATADAAVTDPTAAASIVAALKGLLTDLGQVADAVVAAGAAGSVSAKLRRLTTDLDAAITRLGATSDAAVADPTAAASAIAALKGILTDLGQTADAVVAAGATGSISAKLRRLTTDLDSAITRLGATNDAAQADPAQAASVIAALKGILTDLGLVTSAAETNPAAASANLNSLIRGILSQLQGGGTGSVRAQITGSYPSRAQIDISTLGDNAVIAAPGAGQRLVIVSYSIQNVSATATTVILKSGTTERDKFKFGEREGISWTSPRPETDWALGENEAFNVNLDGANQHTGHVSYRTEAV